MRSGGCLLMVVVAPFALLVAACDQEDTVSEAQWLQAAGEYEESIDLLEPYLQSNPADAEAQYLYGAALTRLSRPSEAQWPLREAMRDPDWVIAAGLVLANNSIVTQNYHSALQAANAVLEVEPDNPVALQLRASAHIVSRRGYEEALEDADRLLELDPDHPDAGVLRAIALLGLYRVDEAEEQLQETAEKRKSVAPTLAANYCVAMVEFFVENEDPEKASAQVEKCLAEHPVNISVVSRALEYYEAGGDAATGLDLLRRTLEEVPRDPTVRYALASRLYANGRAEEAEALMLEAVDFETGAASVAARLELHSYYTEIGSPEKAAETLEAALALLGDGAPSRLQLALVESWVGLGQFEQARKLARKIADPAHRAFGEGYVAIFSDDAALALERYNEGYRTWPDNAAARYYGAYAAEQLGLFDRAIELYRYSIRADPGATDARRRLAELLKREGSITQALETLVTDIEKNPLDEDGLLLSIELAARLGRPDFVRSQLTSIQSTPGLRGRGIAAAARGIAVGSTIDAAIRFVEESKLDVTDPREAELLRLLAIFHARSGGIADAVALVDRAVAASPGTAEPHAIRGLLVEGYGADPQLAERAYARALELDPDHAPALAGLARLAELGGDTERAIELLAAANAADPEDEGIGRAHAAILIESGREEEAAAVLDAHLREHPLDGLAAFTLGQLREQAAPAEDRTLELAERATRFAGSEPAYALLARCLAARGDEQGAQQARTRAEAYRAAAGETDRG